MPYEVQYDDGKSLEADDKGHYTTRKLRPEGFYLTDPAGVERTIKIGYLRVSEMAWLKKLLNEVSTSQIGLENNG